MVVRAFPRFRPFDCYYFMFLLAIKVFSFLLIGRLGYFGLGFTTEEEFLNMLRLVVIKML